MINLLYFMSYDMTHAAREQCAQFFVCCYQSSAVITGLSSDGAHLISRSKLDTHTVYLVITACSAKAVFFHSKWSKLAVAPQHHATAGMHPWCYKHPPHQGGTRSYPIWFNHDGGSRGEYRVPGPPNMRVHALIYDRITSWGDMMHRWSCWIVGCAKWMDFSLEREIGNDCENLRLKIYLCSSNLIKYFYYCTL